jgi:hypothetical protein
MRSRIALILPCAALWMLGACAAHPERGSWGGGAHWPSGQDLGQAVVRAAREPHTWIPLAGAALVSVAGVDDDVSEWAADDQPLFGSDAEHASDVLRDIARATYLATALLAPSESLTDKTTGLLVGAGTLMVTREVTQGLKSLASRRRPDGSDDESFPSGHASSSAAAATLAVANLSYSEIPGRIEGPLKIGIYAVAGATAWARVEAEKHHLSDALAGYALGHFVASFVQAALFEGSPLTVGYQPLPGGGAVSVSMRVDARAE